MIKKIIIFMIFGFVNLIQAQHENSLQSSISEITFLDELQNNYSLVTINAPFPSIKLYKKDYEIQDTLGFAWGSFEEIKPHNASEKVYKIKTQYQPWDMSMYVLATQLSDGKIKNVLPPRRGTAFKNKTHWTVVQDQNQYRDIIT